jgi:hypothetical protein
MYLIYALLAKAFPNAAALTFLGLMVGGAPAKVIPVNPRDQVSKILANARRALEQRSVTSVTVTYISAFYETPMDPGPKILESRRCTTRVRLDSKAALRSVALAIARTRVVDGGEKIGGNFQVGCWLTDRRGKRVHTFYFTADGMTAVVNGYRVRLEGELFPFLRGYQYREKRPSQ